MSHPLARLLPVAFLVACAPEEPPPSECDDAPVLTWANFGEGFVMGQCMGCHASTAQNRFGAPAEVVFDDVDDVWAHKEAVLRVAVGEAPAMPPDSPAPAEDQEKLRLWLTCAEEGT